MAFRRDPPERSEREAALKAAGYNVFGLSSSEVIIDLLTDSGTGTMSTQQWAASIQGDEAYAGSRSFERLEEAVCDVLGFDRVIPAHQGRGAEHVLYGALVDEGDVVLGNTHFDTTRAHVVEAGGKPVDCPADTAWKFDAADDFKGNLDVTTARDHADRVGADRIPAIILTITNNSSAGQPVSVENIRQVRELADELDAKLVIDGCRFAENAWFVREREEEFRGASIAEIAREQLSYADIVLVSGKKDGLVNAGGFLAISDAVDEDLFQRLRERTILYEGFYTYGGMSGRDMAAMAVGLREAVDPGYLDYRIGQVKLLGELLDDAGVPVYRPVGGHAVYIDAAAMFPHIPVGQFPGQALVCQAYLEGGVRAAELGSFAFPDADRPEFVRLALPRRQYHNEHLEHVVETLSAVHSIREEVSGLVVVDEPSRPALRHFSASLRPVD